MHAWAETTTAPALALVQDREDGTFEVLEADEGGVITLRREQSCIESVWTANSGGIERLILANAYSIACCYGEIRQHEQTILVRHGTTDLAPALKQAIAHAHDVADWQTTDIITRTFVDAISEGRDVDPWKRQHTVRVPDDVSKD
jgi:hypothetical protein